MDRQRYLKVAKNRWMNTAQLVLFVAFYGRGIWSNSGLLPAVKDDGKNKQSNFIMNNNLS